MTTTQHTSKSGGIVGYVRGIIDELKKVVWLSRREATYLTVLVLVVSILSAAFLGALDYGFSNLIDKILLGR